MVLQLGAEGQGKPVGEQREFILDKATIEVGAVIRRVERNYIVTVGLRGGMTEIEAPDDFLALADRKVMLEIEVESSAALIQCVGTAIVLIRADQRGIRTGGEAMNPCGLEKAAAEISLFRNCPGASGAEPKGATTGTPAEPVYRSP